MTFTQSAPRIEGSLRPQRRRPRCAVYRGRARAPPAARVVAGGGGGGGTRAARSAVSFKYALRTEPADDKAAARTCASGSSSICTRGFQVHGAVACLIGSAAHAP